MNKNTNNKSSRRLTIAPVLATVLACGGSLGLVSELQANDQRRYDEMAPARPVIDASRMTEAAQTDGQVDEAFVVASVLTETSILTQAWVNYAAVSDVTLGQVFNNNELFVSHLVSSQRPVQYVSAADPISYWELNRRQPANRLVAGGLEKGANLFV